MSDDTFTCQACGGTFTMAWSEEEAMEEARQTFGEAAMAHRDGYGPICDDCHKRFLAWSETEEGRKIMGEFYDSVKKGLS